jgi:hypothetical protein
MVKIWRITRGRAIGFTDLGRRISWSRRCRSGRAWDETGRRRKVLASLGEGAVVGEGVVGGAAFGGEWTPLWHRAVDDGDGGIVGTAAPAAAARPASVTTGSMTGLYSSQQRVKTRAKLSFKEQRTKPRNMI